MPVQGVKAWGHAEAKAEQREGAKALWFCRSSSGSCLLFPRSPMSVICAARDRGSLGGGIFGQCWFWQKPLKSRAVITGHHGKVIAASPTGRVLTLARLFWECFSLCFLWTPLSVLPDLTLMLFSCHQPCLCLWFWGVCWHHVFTLALHLLEDGLPYLLANLVPCISDLWQENSWEVSLVL